MKTKLHMLLTLSAVIAGGSFFTGCVWRDHDRDANYHHHHYIYTCPMHPGVVMDHKGHCPECGMALKRTVAD
jgi:hypothetical protein